MGEGNLVVMVQKEAKEGLQDINTGKIAEFSAKQETKSLSRKSSVEWPGHLDPFETQEIIEEPQNLLDSNHSDRV